MSLQFSSLLLILLAGAFPSILITRRRAQLPAENPWVLTLEALLFGVGFTGAGELLNEWLPPLRGAARWASHIMEQFGPDPQKTVVLPALPTALALSLVLGYSIELYQRAAWTGGAGLFSWMRHRRAKQMIAAKTSGPIQEMLCEAMLQGWPVMLTLNWNKVYAANVLEVPPLGVGAAPQAGLKLLPLLSGYRDKDTREVQFTEDYSATLLAAADNEEERERVRSLFEVCVRQADILAVTWWDPDLFTTFQQAKEPAPGEEMPEIEFIPDPREPE